MTKEESEMRRQQLANVKQEAKATLPAPNFSPAKPAMIDRVACAIWNSGTKKLGVAWKDLSPKKQDVWLEMAKGAIAAMSKPENVPDQRPPI